MRLAYELNRTLDDVLLMPSSEFSYWVAFFKIISERKPSSGQHPNGRLNRR